VTTATATPVPHPAAESAPEPTAVPERCPNCDTTRTGEYCHGCGQHYLDGRLTLRLLLRELAERITIERGLGRTVRDMTLDPGRAIGDYLAGTRRRYVGPFTYLFFGAALSVVAHRFYRHKLDAWMAERMGDAATGDHPMFTPEQAQVYTETMSSLTQQTAYTGLFFCVAFALGVRLLFRRTITLPEAFVLSLYVFGHTFVVHTALIAPWFAVVERMDVFLWFNFLPYPIVAGYAAVRIFGRPLLTLAKVMLALAACYFAFGLLVGGAVIVYVLRTVA
jgi:hypothetical protein